MVFQLLPADSSEYLANGLSPAAGGLMYSVLE